MFGSFYITVHESFDLLLAKVSKVLLSMAYFNRMSLREKCKLQTTFCYLSPSLSPPTCMDGQVVREFSSCGVQVLLAAPTTPVCEALKRNGFFTRYSGEGLFPSVATAVKYARDGHRVVSIIL